MCLKEIIAIVLFMQLSIGNAYAALINVAPGGTATASGTYLTYTPDLAIDGNYSNTWNGGLYPTQWIEIDLGSVFQIVGIKAWVNQQPDGNTQHDVALGGVYVFSWVGFTSFGDILNHDYAAAVSAHTVRITTTSSPSWVAWKEIEIWAEVSSVPEPSTLVLVSLGLAGLGFRQHRTCGSVYGA